jgi:hypothetical protein
MERDVTVSFDPLEILALALAPVKCQPFSVSQALAT